MSNLNLSSWSSGQVAITTSAIEAILKANLEWQQSVFDIQNSQIKIGASSAQITADTTRSSIDDEADSVQSQAIGGLVGGSISGALAGGGALFHSYQESGEVAPFTAKIDSCEDLRATCQANGPGVFVGGAPGGAVADKNALLTHGFIDDPQVQNLTPAQKAAAFRSMTPAEQRTFIRSTYKVQSKLEADRNTIMQQRQNKIQMCTTLGQAAGSISSSTGQLRSVEAKREQAEQEYLKAIANYISQASSLANQMLGSQASDAIGQKRAALDMESQIASSQAAASAG